MRYVLTLLFFTLCASCLGSEENVSNVDAESLRIDDLIEAKVWVCHHPGTKFHDQYCIEAEFPAGCYVEGDSNKFCWLLDQEDCDEEGNKSIQACKLFTEAN